MVTESKIEIINEITPDTILDEFESFLKLYNMVFKNRGTRYQTLLLLYFLNKYFDELINSEENSNMKNILEVILRDLSNSISVNIDEINTKPFSGFKRFITIIFNSMYHIPTNDSGVNRSIELLTDLKFRVEGLSLQENNTKIIRSYPLINAMFYLLTVVEKLNLPREMIDSFKTQISKYESYV